MPARTPEEETRDIRALLAIEPDADLVGAVRLLQTDWRNRGERLVSTRAMLESCLRMLKRSVE